MSSDGSHNHCLGLGRKIPGGGLGVWGFGGLGVWGFGGLGGWGYGGLGVLGESTF